MRRDAEKHRLALIQAAIRVFGRDGYGAPLESILMEANLGRGTLYRHFKDRAALAFAAVDYGLEQLELYVAKNSEDPELFRNFMIMHESTVAFASMVFKENDIEVAQLIFAPLKERTDILYDTVAKQALRFDKVRRDFSAGQIRIISRMLMAAAYGESDELHHDRVAAAFDLILDGVRPR